MRSSSHVLASRLSKDHPQKLLEYLLDWAESVLIQNVDEIFGYREMEPQPPLNILLLLLLLFFHMKSCMPVMSTNYLEDLL